MMCTRKVVAYISFFQVERPRWLLGDHRGPLLYTFRPFMHNLCSFFINGRNNNRTHSLQLMEFYGDTKTSFTAWKGLRAIALSVPK